jgi:hypothetical protein
MTGDQDAHRFSRDDGIAAMNARVRESVHNFNASLAPAEKVVFRFVHQPPYPLGLPVLTPQTWVQYKTQSRDCAVGRFHEELRATSAWREQQPVAREAEAYPMFANVDAALAWYAEAREDGYSSGSAHRAMERLGAMGCQVQGGESRDSAAIVVADKLATMERMLDCAYEERSHGLSRRACLRILFARRVGVLVIADGYGGRKFRKAEKVDRELLAMKHHVTVREVDAIVRSGRERLTVEMAARGLIRMPRASARLLEAVERRMQELSNDR